MTEKGSFAEYFQMAQKRPGAVSEQICARFGPARGLHAQMRAEDAMKRLKLRVNTHTFSNEYDRMFAKLLLSEVHLAILKGEL